MRNLICLGVSEDGYRVFDIDSDDFDVFTKNDFLRYKISGQIDKFFVDKGVTVVYKRLYGDILDSIILTDNSNLIITIKLGTKQDVFSVSAERNFEPVKIIHDVDRGIYLSFLCGCKPHKMSLKDERKHIDYSQSRFVTREDEYTIYTHKILNGKDCFYDCYNFVLYDVKFVLSYFEKLIFNVKIDVGVTMNEFTTCIRSIHVSYE